MEDYATEFLLLLTRIDLRDSEQQLVARFTGWLLMQRIVSTFHCASYLLLGCTS